MKRHDDATARRIGHAIRAAREARGLTQEEVAAALGVKRPTVAGWEIGRRMPGAHMLEKLAAVLGVAPGDLLGRGAETGLGSAEPPSREAQLRQLRTLLRGLGATGSEVRLILQLLEARRTERMLSSALCDLRGAAEEILYWLDPSDHDGPEWPEDLARLQRATVRAGDVLAEAKA